MGSWQGPPRKEDVCRMNHSESGRTGRASQAMLRSRGRV